MTRRRRFRRRLLWVGVLFGLVLLLTTVSVLRVGIWTRGHLVAAKQVAPPTRSSSPDWLERFAAAHSIREPVVDDRFRIDPASLPAPITVTSGREIEWPQIGSGLGLGIALALGMLLAVRMPYANPPVAR